MGEAGSALSPLTSLQLQAQVATLSREVMRLQRQQERSPEKERAPVPIKVRCPPVLGVSLRAWTHPDLHRVLQTVHTASETNGTGAPQEAELRRELAALQTQLEQARGQA